ncbi:LLM class F420-dependent oxidoreductase [Streptomyces diastatochromogenes]|uniref:LLM class F420-dependent oxidoreductase n=1 Tax=Streptomyces diastatochromogenes TaxID=42236 RepID=A0A233S7W1_STRDA|nr:LLM class F420-dependent oxidoreductase [Streptomyces diastatochromogenes]MCZ0984987.1 LLM class F420-dependent oxidoreductase [Streptomyces diastatochromogenes]OXY91684.1 LLM class F420-dependent oxidoreductase [Streptomyces diastatochromogenes]
MKFGFIMFPTQQAIPPGDFGVLLEDRGFESLFMPDHTHIPAVTPERYDVLNLAPEFKNGMDAFVALGAIAQATTTLQIGTAVLLVTERDPIVTAKEVASVDVLSGGRMHFGVGPGWINQEMRNHGTNPDDRWRVMRERVEAMRQIWTHDIASYHGDFVNFDHVTSWPKPVRKPHPPILVAGNGPNVAKRVIAYGDEWIPMLRPGVLDDIAEFKKTARRPGSDEPLPVTLFGGELEDVDAYAAAGVDRVLFWVRPQDTARMTRTVDQIALHLGGRLG